jgi:hypothetical protein
MLPELLTAALKATFPPEVVKVNALVGVELETALLTVIAAVLLRVAEPTPSLVSSTAGVMFEVLAPAVYQVPLIHSPVESNVPVETVMPAGMPLVVKVCVAFANPGAVNVIVQV